MKSLFAFAVSVGAATPPPPTQQWTVSVPVDHFSAELDSPSFPMRIWRYDKYAKDGGPIFFYSGNEGGIESFWENTGILFIEVFFW